MNRLKACLIAVAIAFGAAMFFGGASQAAPVQPVETVSQENAVQKVGYGHRRWRSHHRWGSRHYRRYWHSRWRSHHRWGSRGYGHNRHRSHHRWGSYRY